VLAAALVEKNPELCMDEAINVVLEWILSAGNETCSKFWVYAIRFSTIIPWYNLRASASAPELTVSPVRCG
jgi:hypothetical protein